MYWALFNGFSHFFTRIYIYIWLLCSGPRYGSVQFLFNTGKMCKFSRTLYNRQFVCCPFYKISKSRESNYISVQLIAWCLRDLRVQFLELYTACILTQYHWDKEFHFLGNFHFLVKMITDSVRLGVVYLNLVLSKTNEVLFCEIYLQPAAHNDVTTIHYSFKIYFISRFLTDRRSLTPDPRSSDPSFPVNLKVLLIKIVLFFRPLK